MGHQGWREGGTILWREGGDGPAAGRLAPVCTQPTGGRLLLDGGSSTAPPLSFVGVTNLGWYRVGSTMSAAQGGAQKLAIGSSLNAISALRISGDFRGVKGTQAITAVGDTIGEADMVMELDPDANYVLTSTPTIDTGADGQLLIVLNIDAAFSITLQDESNLANSKIRGAGGTDIVLGPYDSALLIYSNTDGYWHQVQE